MTTPKGRSFCSYKQNDKYKIIGNGHKKPAAETAAG